MIIGYTNTFNYLLGLNQMTEDIEVAKIFGYTPGTIDLIGFPSIDILDSLRGFLGREMLLKEHRKEGKFRGFRVEPCFDPKYAKKRQAFFKGVQTSKKRPVNKSFFEKSLPRVNLRYTSMEGFLGLCDEISRVLTTARAELGDFQNIAEAERILGKANQVDSQLEKMLDVLKSIDNSHIFAVDTKKGLIANIAEMPTQSISFTGERDQGYFNNLVDTMLYEIRTKAKKNAVELAEEIGVFFKRGIMDFARREFSFDPDTNNLRKHFEQLAMPLRLHSHHEKFLRVCAQYEVDLVEERIEDWTEEDYFEDDLQEILCEDLGPFFAASMPQPVYTKSSNHYDIRGLFPPELMSEYRRGTKPFVPIDVKTEPGENKFLLAGLHSGGKSFWLRQLVLITIGDLLGLKFPANKIVLPKYNNIYYYRNPDEPGREGKLEEEIRDVSIILSKLKKGDVAIIDEFLDSAIAESANYLSPLILDKLMASEATIFIASHRCTDYQQLVKKGWTILTPDHEIYGDKVRPTKRIIRGIPDRKINERYVREQFGNIFES